MRTYILLMALSMALVPQVAEASRKDLCDGYKDGWEAAYKEQRKAPTNAPFCPNLSYSGKNAYDLGFDRGKADALKKIKKR